MFPVSMEEMGLEESKDMWEHLEKRVPWDLQGRLEKKDLRGTKAIRESKDLWEPLERIVSRGLLVRKALKEIKAIKAPLVLFLKETGNSARGNL